MSRLDNLLKELCPNGVEYKTIGDIGTLTRGKRFVHADAVEEGIPCIHYGELYTYYGIATLNTKSFVRKELAPKLRYAHKNDVIIVGAGENDWDIGIAVAYLGDDEVAVHDACYIFKQDNDPKYISYCLRSTDYHQQIKKYVSTGKICAISAEGLSKAKIPIPPLEVQHKIVQILDKFDNSTTKLVGKLKDEYDMRQKQYEYYRDHILSDGNDVTWQPLLEVASTSTGLTYKPGNISSDGILVLRSSNIQNSRLVFEDNVYVNMDQIPERACVKEGDILVCVRNGSKALIGKAALIPEVEKTMAFGAFMTILRPNEKINGRYLFYVWQSAIIQNMIHGNSGMPINQITKKMLEQINVPVPSIAQQEKIVSILDEYDKAHMELLDKLMSETKARIKQYSYYRDALLTFDEAI